MHAVPAKRQDRVLQRRRLGEHGLCTEHKVPDGTWKLRLEGRHDIKTREQARLTALEWKRADDLGGKEMTNQLAVIMTMTPEEKAWYEEIVENHKRE